MDVDSRVVGSTGGVLHYYFRNKLGQRSVLITWNLVSLPFDGRFEVREVDIG